MSLLIAAVLFARITVIEPKDAAAFEAGYRKHLEWHRAHNDPWTWHGWSVISGERLGWFIDATLGHEAAELDAPVAPAEDAADNRITVSPHARFASSAFYRERPDLATATAITAPYAELITIHVVPGEREQFETALRAQKRTAICLELISGGAAPSYLLLVPAEKLSAMLHANEFAHAQSVTVEALRYRSDLTYTP